MTGNKITLVLKAESNEGIHDFIPILEEVVEEIKGGSEEGEIRSADYFCEWSIVPDDK